MLSPLTILVSILKPGEVVGFLGPNGAGKSTKTNEKCWRVFLPQAVAKISIFKYVPQKIKRGQSNKVIGYLPEGAPDLWWMTTLQGLNFIAQIRGYSAMKRKNE